MSIHNRIKARRLELGLRMQDVSDPCGFKSWQTVQAWEHGKAAPSRAKMPLVAKALKVSEEWLLHGYNSTKLTELEKSVLSAIASLTADECQQVIDFAHGLAHKKTEAIESARALLKKLSVASVQHTSSLNDEEKQLMQLLMNFSAAKPDGKALIEIAAKAAAKTQGISKIKPKKAA